MSVSIRWTRRVLVLWSGFVLAGDRGGREEEEKEE